MKIAIPRRENGFLCCVIRVFERDKWARFLLFEACLKCSRGELEAAAGGWGFFKRNCWLSPNAGGVVHRSSAACPRFAEFFPLCKSASSVRPKPSSVHVAAFYAPIISRKRRRCFSRLSASQPCSSSHWAKARRASVRAWARPARSPLSYWW